VACRSRINGSAFPGRWAAGGWAVGRFGTVFPCAPVVGRCRRERTGAEVCPVFPAFGPRGWATLGEGFIGCSGDFERRDMGKRFYWWE